MSTFIKRFNAANNITSATDTNFFRAKLTKKWIFLKFFKKIFLWKPKVDLFVKLKTVLNQKKILFCHFSKLYGSGFKRFIFVHSKNKVIFGKKFYLLLNLLETRLNILLVRLRFFTKLLLANLAIFDGNIFINGFVVKSNCLIFVSDLILYKFSFLLKASRYLSFNWRFFSWRKWIRFSTNSAVARNWVSIKMLSKICVTVNYLEINYKVQAGILLRKPIFGEILLGSKQVKSQIFLFKKIYFLY